MSLKASVCIDAVLEGVPLEQALNLVAKCGYQAFEFWRWWDKDLDLIQRARDQHSLQIAACCTHFISLVDPSLRQQYLDGLALSVEAAQRLDCPVLISQVGDFRPDISRQEQHDCLVEGLRAASKVLSGTDIHLAIEPLNELVDHVGYYLVRSEEAFAIIEEVASPNIKVTYDIYHQQISEGQLTANIEANIEKIAHFHAAGNPGRQELSCGEINYPYLIEKIRKTGFNGYIGLEYWPRDAVAVGLREAAAWFPSDNSGLTR